MILTDQTLTADEYTRLGHLMQTIKPRLYAQNFDPLKHFIVIDSEYVGDQTIVYRFGITNRQHAIHPCLKRKKRFWWLPFRKGGGRG